MLFRSDVSISKAEDFLASLLSEDEQPNGQETNNDPQEVTD